MIWATNQYNALNKQIQCCTQHTAANKMQNAKAMTLVALLENWETKEYPCYVTEDLQKI